MPDAKHILQVLRDELALQTRHCKLLEAQEQALLACDRARFTDLQDDYASVLVALEAQDAARRAALEDGSGPLTLSQLKDLVPAKSRHGLDALGDGLTQTLDRIQTLSRRNKTLIQNELDYFAFTLDLFVEAGRSSDASYGPRGMRSGHLTGRLMLDRRA